MKSCLFALQLRQCLIDSPHCYGKYKAKIVRHAFRRHTSPPDQGSPRQPNSFGGYPCAADHTFCCIYRDQGINELLEGGLPLGAVTEIVGRECFGRTSLAISFLAQMTQTEKVCAWIDASDTLDPESAAAVGVDLSRLLWVRCGVQTSSRTKPTAQQTFSLPDKHLVAPPPKKGLHGGGFGGPSA